MEVFFFSDEKIDFFLLHKVCKLAVNNNLAEIGAFSQLCGALAQRIRKITFFSRIFEPFTQ